MGNMKRIAYFGFGSSFGSLLLLSLLASPAAAQTQPSTQPTSSQGQQGSSLGDYARQVKKDGAPAKARPKVFDNDNLPTEDKLSVIGEARPATTAQNGTETRLLRPTPAPLPGNRPSQNPPRKKPPTRRPPRPSSGRTRSTDKKARLTWQPASST